MKQDCGCFRSAWATQGHAVLAGELDWDLVAGTRDGDWAGHRGHIVVGHLRGQVDHLVDGC